MIKSGIILGANTVTSGKYFITITSVGVSSAKISNETWYIGMACRGEGLGTRLLYISM